MRSQSPAPSRLAHELRQRDLVGKRRLAIHHVRAALGPTAPVVARCENDIVIAVAVDVSRPGYAHPELVLRCLAVDRDAKRRIREGSRPGYGRKAAAEPPENDVHCAPACVVAGRADEDVLNAITIDIASVAHTLSEKVGARIASDHETLALGERREQDDILLRKLLAAIDHPHCSSVVVVCTGSDNEI